VLKTWAKAFSGLMQPKDSIPADLAKHFRYPEDYFKVQRELLTKYHVTDPGVFYGGEDFWQIPGDPTQSITDAVNSSAAPSTTTVTNSGPAQPPYYVLLQMPGTTAPAFSLTSTFVARNGTNLTAFASVSSDPGDYGKIRVLELPKTTNIDGPGQVANTFESNATVSRALSLLRTGGSEVVLGNLLTLPVGNGLLYVEPVYTQAKQAPQFPILQDVIVSFGSSVAFQPTLTEALNQLFGQGSVTPTPGATGTPSPGTTTPPVTNQTVATLIADAQAAYDQGQTALKAGDFAAYGQAQAALKTALDALAKANGTSATPTPRPSP
jgi:uncharacterized membrane protein (UPF0182 family)